PQKVKVTSVLLKATSPPPGPVNFCAAEAVRQDSATSLEVDGGRATVMVFESLDDADDWTPMPECAAKPFRIRNVIAVPIRGRAASACKRTTVVRRRPRVCAHVRLSRRRTQGGSGWNRAPQ